MSEQFSNTGTTLAAAITAAATSITLTAPITDPTGVPLTGSFRLGIGTEIIAVPAGGQSNSGVLIGVTRGTEGTTAASAASGAVANAALTAGGVNQLIADTANTSGQAILTDTAFVIPGPVGTYSDVGSTPVTVNLARAGTYLFTVNTRTEAAWSGTNATYGAIQTQLFDTAANAAIAGTTMVVNQPITASTSQALSGGFAFVAQIPNPTVVRLQALVSSNGAMQGDVQNSAEARFFGAPGGTSLAFVRLSN